MTGGEDYCLVALGVVSPGVQYRNAAADYIVLWSSSSQPDVIPLGYSPAVEGKSGFSIASTAVSKSAS